MKIGKASSNNRIELKTDKKLHNHSKEVMPNYPVHMPAPPAQRALQHKQGAFWTKASMSKACNEFLIPSDMKEIFICPDIFDRELLVGLKEFQCGPGVLSPCPKCGHQKFMRHAGWTTMQAYTQKVRNKELTQDAIVGGVYQCYNLQSECCKMVGKEKKQKSPSTFTTYSGPLWRQYPESVKKRYTSYISKVEDRTTNCMVSPGFADRLMYHKGTFDSFCNQMRSAMDERCKAAYRGYYTFVREQREIMASLRKPKGMLDANFEYYETMKWPGFSN
jgi:predicted  nucleic acid-binding Zn-ribbon protein